MDGVSMSAVTYRYCAKCRGERQVDGETFRCLTCGMATKYTGTSSEPTRALAQTEPVTGATVTLPSTTRSRQWIEHTQALADSFAKAAQEAERRATTASAEAERLRRAASAFQGLLKQVNVEQAPVKSNGVLNGRWSRKYDACIACGTTEILHAARGLCRTCQGKPENRSKVA